MPMVAAAAARRGSLVLDFSAIEYISSVGLRVLMIAAKQMREHEGRLLVAALQSVVAEIFAISRFDRILTVHRDARRRAWRSARRRRSRSTASAGPAP